MVLSSLDKRFPSFLVEKKRGFFAATSGGRLRTAEDRAFLSRLSRRSRD